VGYLLLAALTLVLAGFIVRHDIGPSVWSAIIHRTPSRASRDPDRSIAPAGGTSQAPAAVENLSASDRESLSATVRRSSR
jgi:hypothetical protein